MRIIAALCLLFVGFQPAPPLNEMQWSDRIAHEMGLNPDKSNEYKLPDGTRVDIVDHQRKIAWEVDWCKSGKIYEAIGQSRYYAISLSQQTGEEYRSGVYLLMKGECDEHYLRCLTVCAKDGIILKTKRVPK